MTLTVNQEQELTGGGECYLHNHPEDRVPTHDTLNRLQNLAAPKTVTANYTVDYSDDHILVPAAYTVTLPRSRANKEFEVTRTGTSNVTVAAYGTETICGSSTALLTAQWMSLRVKGVTNGWIVI